MVASEPIDPRVRLAISQWPVDAPRGAVSTFCAEHGISRKSFYELRERARVDGPASVLEPRTRRPRASPSRLTEEVKEQAIGVRAALEASGLDHGPISVHDKMHAMGLNPVPSTASLSRIFREAGVARAEPKKRPRSAWRRFVYPAPNACWQLDATEYVLTGGRKCVIFQLIDDHSRYAVASTSRGLKRSKTRSWSSTRQSPPTACHNGCSQTTGSRSTPRGEESWASSWSTSPGSGSRRSPASPTSRPPRARTNASTRPCSATLTSNRSPSYLEELQSLVDTFDRIYNIERPHQGLPGRVTPLRAWEATPKADPPRPNTQPDWLDRPVPHRPKRPRQKPPVDLPADTRLRKVSSGGTIHVDKVTYRSTSTTRSSRSSWSTTPRPSSSATSTARSSPDTPAQHRGSPASATADPADPDQENPECHPCPDTSHGVCGRGIESAG